MCVIRHMHGIVTCKALKPANKTIKGAVCMGSYGVSSGWLEVYTEGLCELKEKHTLSKGGYLIVSDPVLYEDMVCVVIRNIDRLFVLPIRDLCEIDNIARNSTEEGWELFTVAERSVLLFLQLKQYELAGADGWFNVSYEEIVKHVGGIEKRELRQLLTELVTAGYLEINKTPMYNNYGKVLPYAYKPTVTGLELPYSGFKRV